MVVMRTKIANTNVQMGSANFHSGCKELQDQNNLNGRLTVIRIMFFFLSGHPMVKTNKQLTRYIIALRPYLIWTVPYLATYLDISGK